MIKMTELELLIYQHFRRVRHSNPLKYYLQLTLISIIITILVILAINSIYAVYHALG